MKGKIRKKTQKIALCKMEKITESFWRNLTIDFVRFRRFFRFEKMAKNGRK